MANRLRACGGWRRLGAWRKFGRITMSNFDWETAIITMTCAVFFFLAGNVTGVCVVLVVRAMS